QIIRNEFVAWHHSLHDRMTSSDDVEIVLAAHRRANVSLARRDISQRAQHIELRDRARDVLEPSDLAAGRRARRLEQLALARLDAFSGRQNAFLVFLERRPDNAL